MKDAKPREFWIDGPVCPIGDEPGPWGFMFSEKPDYDNVIHVVEHSALTEALAEIKRLRIEAIDLRRQVRDKAPIVRARLTEATELIEVLYNHGIEEGGDSYKAKKAYAEFKKKMGDM